MFQTKEDQVATFIREGILANRFPRGFKLKQVELAAMIGTSITPVREALKLLEAEGFVVGNSHRGAIVAPFDLDAAEEIVELRVMLEGRLLLAAVPKLTPEELVCLQELQLQFEDAARSGLEVRAINYRFHELLYLAARQPETLRCVRTLWARYPFEIVNAVPGRLGRVIEEHRRILNALTMGDISMTLAALVSHIRIGWAELKTATLRPTDSGEGA